MRLNDMIYFSRNRLNAFFPDRPQRGWPVASAEIDLKLAKLDLKPAPSSDTADAEARRLGQVRRQIEREASYSFAPNLAPGQWIFFDLDMGWGTSHADSRLPDLDDVVFFYAPPPEPGTKPNSAELLLCGSTEHLLKKTASAGRMGSGTTWLYEVIREINSLDAGGETSIPDALIAEALAVPRVNQPVEVVRWVYDMIARHHPPYQRAHVQGLARVDLIAPENELCSRLVVATPLCVYYASRRSVRLVTRLRLHRDLCRRHRRPIWKWYPDLPPRYRARYYLPPGGSSGEQ